MKAGTCQEVKSQVHSFQKRDLFTLFTTPREHKAGAQQSGIFAPGPGRNFESKAVPRCCKEGLDLQLHPKASFRRGIPQNGENELWQRLGTAKKDALHMWRPAPGDRGQRKQGLCSQAPTGPGLTVEGWYPEPQLEPGWRNGPSPPGGEGCRGGVRRAPGPETRKCAPQENTLEEVRVRAAWLHPMNHHLSSWVTRPWNLTQV